MQFANTKKKKSWLIGLALAIAAAVIGLVVWGKKRSDSGEIANDEEDKPPVHKRAADAAYGAVRKAARKIAPSRFPPEKPAPAEPPAAPAAQLAAAPVEQGDPRSPDNVVELTVARAVKGVI